MGNRDSRKSQDRDAPFFAKAERSPAGEKIFTITCCFSAGEFVRTTPGRVICMKMYGYRSSSVENMKESLGKKRMFLSLGIKNL